jgi:hypothetical protein
MTTPYGRWADDLSPVVGYIPDTYSHKAAGPVQRAALRAVDGQLLGHVWTDDREAAGFLPDEQAGIAGRRAATDLWVIMRECKRRDVPASELLDPSLYEPYQLDV